MSRNLGLDILRGVAILLVLGSHTPTAGLADTGVVEPLAHWFKEFGWSGVDLFFVLSGFLIGGLLFQDIRMRGEFDLKRFLIRRGMKIWPSYYMLLFVTVLMLTMGFGGARYRAPTLLTRSMIPAFHHLQNYFSLNDLMIHTWSLAVEEHFYVLLPIFLSFVPWIRDDKRQVLAIPLVPLTVFGLVVGCNLLRVQASSRLPFDTRYHQFPTHLRIDSLAFGVLLAYLRAFVPATFDRLCSHKVALLIFGLLIILPVMLVTRGQSVFVQTVGFTLLYVGYGAILLAIVSCTSPLMRWFKWIGSLGVISYPVYLWHVVLGGLPVEMLQRAGLFNGLGPELRWLLSFGLMLVFAITAGAILGALVDRPVLLIRERLFPARSQALESSGEDPAIGLENPVDTLPTGEQSL